MLRCRARPLGDLSGLDGFVGPLSGDVLVHTSHFVLGSGQLSRAIGQVLPQCIQLPGHRRGVQGVDGRRHRLVELPLASGCFPLDLSLLAMVTVTGAIQRGLAAIQPCRAGGQQSMPSLDGLPHPLLDRRDRQTRIAGPFVEFPLQRVEPCFAFITRALTPIGQRLTLVGGTFALVGDVLTFVGRGLAFVGQPLAFLGRELSPRYSLLPS